MFKACVPIESFPTSTGCVNRSLPQGETYFTSFFCIYDIFNFPYIFNCLKNTFVSDTYSFRFPDTSQKEKATGMPDFSTFRYGSINLDKYLSRVILIAM